MKPFKFRVWDKLNECFSSDEFFIDKDGTLLEKYYDHDAVDYVLSEDYENRYEASVSTGLYFLDDEGEETDLCIFSGDIVTDGESNYLVKYDECEAKFIFVNTIDYREYDFSCVDDLSDIKLKGNKFENPELLENLK